MPEGGGGFQISPQELESHEDEVRELMSNMQGAASGAFNTLDVNAFGVVGLTWSWALHHWTGAAENTLQQAVDAGNHIADQLKAMRETHVGNDKAAADAFTKIHKGME
jgi:hypothetical protein